MQPERAAEHDIEELARFVRTETVRLISIAKIGHYASTFSAAEILAVLYGGHLRLRSGDPTWVDRDRFLLGKGHCAVGVYPLLARWQFFDAAVLDTYTKLGNPLGDHPDMTKVPGIDFTSGSLGHALSAGVGMALGGRIQGQEFDVFVLLGDGEHHEGQVWEAALAAAHHRLSHLVAIVDRNRLCLDGDVDEITGVEPLADKWRSFGWEVSEVDGHDIAALRSRLAQLRADDQRERPAIIIAHTVKGKGVSFMENELGWHLGWLNPTDERAVLAELERST
jgi:transketolase